MTQDLTDEIWLLKKPMDCFLRGDSVEQITTSILPASASQVALWWDELFYFVTGISLLFFVPLVLAMIFFVFNYNSSRGKKVEDTHGNTPLEILWTAVPTLIVIIIFAWGWLVYKKQHRPPPGAMEIRVTGMKWDWMFTYENGKESVKEIVVPVGQRVKLLMTSKDVIHSFFVPDFRTKSDVVPGLYSTVWFEAEKIGEHQVYCSEYCGNGHSRMLATLKVVSYDNYKDWVKIEDTSAQTPAQRGQNLILMKGCSGCHSIDGSAMQGPSFKGLWGKNETLADGTKVTVDTKYIRNKILNPNGTSEVKGYPAGIMPSFQGMIEENEILDIIAYIKTLK